MFDLTQLRESGDFLRTVVDNITSALFVVGRDIRVRSFNDSFGALFHKQEDQVIGELCGNAIGCAYTIAEGRACGATTHCGKCGLRNSVLQAFTEKVPTYRQKLVRDFEIQGELILKYFLYSTKYVVYAEEEVILVVVDDITDIEEQRIRLEELNQLKNKFLGMAAHDLRNPLASIRGFSELLLGEDMDPLSDDQRQFLQTMHSLSHDMLNMVNDLLDVSTIESGKLEIRREPGSIRDLIESRVHMNAVLAGTKGMTMKCSLGDVTEASFDHSRIGQVLDNLISNAIKYSPPGSSIHVSLGRKGTMAEIRVTDEGPGIEPKEQERLFGEFQKMSTKPTGGEKSTGLGLAIARRMVEAHNGTIGVESMPGSGSTFKFMLPLGGDDE